VRRLHSMFPGGLPGLGLLLLRIAIGAKLLVGGSACLLSAQNLAPSTQTLAVLALLTGVAFLLGFATSALAGMSALIALWTHLWHSQLASGSFVNDLLHIDLIVMSSALALLGPGAFSVDAHLFGRKKIVIPRAAS
jgi:uncharacterized membrane protein YphA (DoxX/SURF4 family)